MNGFDHVQDNKTQNVEACANQKDFMPRNSETFLIVSFFAGIWLLPFIRAAEAGGLGGIVIDFKNGWYFVGVFYPI